MFDSCIVVLKKLIESFWRMVGGVWGCWGGRGGLFWSVRIPPLHRPTDRLAGVNQQLADLPLSHFCDVMHVDVTRDGVFYCPRRRPGGSEGEDLGAEGGRQVQAQDRLQGEAGG